MQKVEALKVIKACLKIDYCMLLMHQNQRKKRKRIWTTHNYQEIWDYDADKALKTAKINKNMTEIKENCDEDKILRDLDFTFDPEKDHYEPKKTVSAFNNNYTQYDRIGDKDNLSIK